MKKIFLTGQDGFLGSHLTSTLEKKYLVYGLVKTGRPKKNIVVADITKKKPIKIPRNCIILHCAGVTSKSGKSKEDFFSVNLEGTKNVFRSSLKSKPERFIFISSNHAAIRGKSNASKTFLSTFYGESKLAAEAFLKKSCREKKIPLTILRVTGIYGPRMPLNTGYGKTFLRLFKQKYALNLSNAKYQMTFVKNAAEIIAKTVESKKDFELYTVADRPELSFREISRLVSKKGNLREIKVPKILFYFLGVLGSISIKVLRRRTLPNLQSIKNVINPKYEDWQKIYRAYKCRQKYTQKQGIEETTSWMRKNS